MNNFYQNQNQSGSQNSGGIFGGQAQLPAQINLPLEGQAQKAVLQHLQENPQVSAAQVPYSSSEITFEMKKTYEEIFNAYGVDAANNWLKQEIINNHLHIQNDNNALLNEIHANHGDLYLVPAIKEAILAYLDKDVKHSVSLRDQGFHHVAHHLSNVYKCGHEAGMNLRNQNDSAKARMTSAVNSAAPHYQSNKNFTRSDIKSMSPEDFIRNEKAIFDQLNKGLIK